MSESQMSDCFSLEEDLFGSWLVWGEATASKQRRAGAIDRPRSAVQRGWSVKQVVDLASIGACGGFPLTTVAKPIKSEQVTAAVAPRDLRNRGNKVPIWRPRTRFALIIFFHFLVVASSFLCSNSQESNENHSIFKQRLSFYKSFHPITQLNLFAQRVAELLP